MPTHTIWVNAPNDGKNGNCLQIFDGDTEKNVSNTGNHENGAGLRKLIAAGDDVTWQCPIGAAQLTITFTQPAPPQASPFATSTAGPSNPVTFFNAVGDAGRYKYTITLKVGGKTFIEDPQIIIDPQGVEGDAKEIVVIEEPV